MYNSKGPASLTLHRPLQPEWRTDLRSSAPHHHIHCLYNLREFGIILVGADRQTKKTAPGRSGPGLSDYSFWKPYVGDMRISIGEETRGDFALRGAEVRRSGFVGVRNGRVEN